MVDLINKLPHPTLILSLDAQKAFDRLNWPYMFANLSHYGFIGPFLNALKALYSPPTVWVLLASFLSPGFPLANGTRQGCPQSHLLFIFCLEPLAEAI